MSEVLGRRYFRWLKRQIRIPSEKTYNDLLDELHQKEFVWIVPNDHNRLADAFDLRREFLGEGHQISRHGVSTLEVLVALSRRLEFQAGGKAKVWAWQLIENLDLHHMTDPLSKRKRQLVDELLEALIWRTYDRDGTGGFFPIAWPQEDQTKVEIWYQMAGYVNELPS
jgi:hypothetical protein